MELTSIFPSRVQNRGAKTDVRGVQVFSWNPRPPILRVKGLNRIRRLSRVNNFGDLLGPLIVDEILEARGIVKSVTHNRRRLLAVGSVLHFARDGDVVWGTGMNGKMPTPIPASASLDVRAVRGPKTRQRLLQHGIETPEVYGDPALLVPVLFPALLEIAKHKTRDVLLAPNLNDFRSLAGRRDVLNPRAPLDVCVRQIAESERVVGTSLHGLVIAEALGIPAVPVSSPVEHPFKYEDYYAGTGRTGVRLSPDIRSALSGRYTVPGPQWDPTLLQLAFPLDMWK